MSRDSDLARRLFAEASELPAAARVAFLDEACGADNELRREVESLLKAERRMGSFLEGKDLGSLVDRTLGDGDGDESMMGRTLGPYRIVERIARGGMGVVYRAEQTNPDRQVALKVMGRDLYSVNVARRFELEVQVLGRLQHPGIAQIFDAGTTETADGARPYFAMEYIDGLPLTRWAGEQGLDLRARLELMIKICDAVQHAHRKGVIHRDLKPANILVDRGGHPKVLDFGVARATEADLQITTVERETGRLLGTLAYMSPEQVRGDAAVLDTRSDIYALGVVGYELVAGQLPHDLKGKSITEAIRVIAEREPRPLASIGVTVPADLQTILLKALATEPDRRYESVSAVAEDLQRFLDERPILARPPSAIYHLRKLVARNRLAAALTSLVLVLVVAGGIVMAVQNSRIRAERDTADQVSSFLRSLFTVSDPRVARGNELTAREILDRGAERIETELTGQPLVQGRLMLLMGNIYRELGFQDEARHLLDRGLELGRDLLEDDPRLAVLSLNGLAWVHRNVGEFEPGLEVARQGLELAETRLKPDDPARGTTLITTGVLLRDLQDFESAREMLDRALEFNLRIHGEVSGAVGTTYYHMGWLQHLQGESDAALETYDHACEVLEEAVGADHTMLAWCYNDQAVVLGLLRRNEEAGQLLQRALRIWERVLPEGHPHLASAANNLAGQYYFARDYERAAAEYRRVLEMRKEALGANHVDVGYALGNIGMALRELGHWDEAEAHLLRGNAIIEAARGPDDSQVINNLFGLAQLYLKWGRFEEAHRIHERCVASQERTHGADHLFVAGALDWQARTLMLLRRFEQAEPLLARALAIADARVAPENPTRQRMAVRLADCYRRHGRAADARRVLGQTRTILEESGSNGPALADAYLVLSRLARSEGDPEEARTLAERAVEIRRAFQPEDHGDLLYAEAVSQQALDKLRQALEAGFFYYDVDLDVDLAALPGTAELEGLMARYEPSGR